MYCGDSMPKRSAGPGQNRLSLASSKRGPPGTLLLLLLWASSSTLLRLRSSLQGASVRCHQRESSAAASSTTPRPLGNQLEQPPAGKQAFIQILPAQSRSRMVVSGTASVLCLWAVAERVSVSARAVQTEIGSAEVGGSENPNLRQAVAGVSEQGCLHKRREGG